MAFENTEMKDVILATLAEIENDINETENKKSAIDENLTLDIQDSPFDKTKIESKTKTTDVSKWKIEEQNAQESINQEKELASILYKLEENTDDEDEFLSGMRERLLVLFEGLKSLSNQRVEKKLNLTIGYLEYTLAIIDERLENKQNKTS